ncbi:site-specific integrase [Kordiimonas pumila]|uniref:Tyrosine-type recombinase/integrase n=1 Tax=Kordiimonas pumila TaxID=2161677 RepID=A0ABV7D2Z5_9PROT|nr:site-specific integrase [Kordiimonas pumila]
MLSTKPKQVHIARLRWLHQFGVENYGWDINIKLTKFLQVSKSLTFVRTSILDHRHVYNVLEAIETLEEPEIYQTQLKLILIFGFRCGLRIGEILKFRFRDIDPKSGWTVYVRGSRHGSNKSDNALRRLELSVLFTADELELLKHYYHKLGLDNGRGALLFGLDGENIPLDQIVVSQKLGGALRQSTGNEEVVFHSLRHSCATYTWTILSKEHELAHKLTGYDAQKLASVRRYWMMGDDLVRDALWQMTKGLGHASPATSAQTYLHLVMETVHRKLGRAIWDKESLQLSLKRFGNLRAKKLREGYQATMTTLVKRVHERVRFGREEKRILGTAGRKCQPNLTFDLPETYLILAGALQKLEAGQSIAGIALQYPVVEEDLEGIVYRCRKLAAVKTKKGGAKFIGDKAGSEDTPQNAIQEVLIPDLHNSPDVLRLAIKVSNILRNKCQKKRPRKAIVKQAMAVLKAFTASKHYLRITTREDLSAILNFDQDAIPSVFWSMKGKPLAKRGEDSTESLEQEAYRYWMSGRKQEFINIRLKAKETNKKPRYRYGVLRASLAHSTESLNSGNDKRFLGVKMLGWLAYMTVILYGTNEEVDAFVAGNKRKLL